MTAAQSIGHYFQIPLIALAKRATQYQLTAQVKMEDVPDSRRLPKFRMSSYFECVYHVLDVQIHGLKYKTRSYHLKGTYTDAYYQDYFVSDKSKILTLRKLGESTLERNACSVHHEQGLFRTVYVNDIKMTGKKTVEVNVEKVQEKRGP